MFNSSAVQITRSHQPSRKSRITHIPWHRLCAALLAAITHSTASAQVATITCGTSMSVANEMEFSQAINCYNNDTYSGPATTEVAINLLQDFSVSSTLEPIDRSLTDANLTIHGNGFTLTGPGSPSISGIGELAIRGMNTVTVEDITIFNSGRHGIVIDRLDSNEETRLNGVIVNRAQQSGLDIVFGNTFVDRAVFSLSGSHGIQAGGDELTVNETLFFNNTSSGIESQLGAILTVGAQSEFTGNTIGINVASSPQTNISDTVIAFHGGVGVNVTGSVVSLDNVWLDDNETGLQSSNFSILTVKNSSATKNDFFGLSTNGGELLVQNSTVSENGADGIFVGGETEATVANSTVTNNGNDGITISSFGDDGIIPVALKSSIVANNVNNCSDSLEDEQPINDLGANVSDNDACKLNLMKSVVSPKAIILGPLQDNGCTITSGPFCATTQQPFDGNPAVGAGSCDSDNSSNPQVPAIMNDQYNNPRLNCDAGALNASASGLPGIVLSPGDWNQLSLPFIGSPAITVADLFGQSLPLSEFFVTWAVFEYELGSDQSLDNYRQMELGDPLPELGNAFWVQHFADEPIAIVPPDNAVAPLLFSNSTACLSNGSNCNSYPLSNGVAANEEVRWTMLGSVFTTPAGLNAIRVDTSIGTCNTQLIGCTLAQSLSLGLTNGSLFSYNNDPDLGPVGDYRVIGPNQAQLYPWNGFWIGERPASAASQTTLVITAQAAN